DALSEAAPPSVSVPEPDIEALAIEEIAERAVAAVEASESAPVEPSALENAEDEARAAAEFGEDDELGSAAVLPERSAGMDEDDEEPNVTLADWTERIRKLEHRPTREEMEEEDEEEDERRRPNFVPLALSIVLLSLFTGFLVWQFTSENQTPNPAATPS